MEDNKPRQFSSETEEIYNKKTESSIKIPDGFKEKIMENVKNEKAKKNGILKWVAIAACLVIVVGVIILVPALMGKDKAPEANDEATEDVGTQDDALADKEEVESTNDTTSAEDHLAAEKCDPILVGYEKVDVVLAEDLGITKGARAVMVLNKHKFVLHEGHEMNWYEFYNGCIDGTVGNDKDAILDYAEAALKQFEAVRMTEEATQAQAVIDALKGSEN